MKTVVGTSIAVWMGLVSVVHAESRFALVMGNNLGAPDEQPLRWAEKDAERYARLLGHLGDVPDDHRLLLTNQTVTELRAAVASLRGQVAAAVARGERTMLLVFYSGHADQQALHLRDTRLALTDFQALVRTVPSQATLVMVDACHSGELVRGRNKGATPTPLFNLSYRREVGPQGYVLITSAGAGEVTSKVWRCSSTLENSILVRNVR